MFHECRIRSRIVQVQKHPVPIAVIVQVQQHNFSECSAQVCMNVLEFFAALQSV